MKDWLASRILNQIMYIARNFAFTMGIVVYLLLAIPVLLSFFVLYAVDAKLERRINRPAAEAIIEVLIVLAILILSVVVAVLFFM